ncbi:MAG: DUF2469 family protein [Actinomycetota bacterium]
MSVDDLEKYEAEVELALYREYRDVIGMFAFVVETEKRFYLANEVEVVERGSDANDIYFEVTLRDAWVWDMYRATRFVQQVKIRTFSDVNVEEIKKGDLDPRELAN